MKKLYCDICKEEIKSNNKYSEFEVEFGTTLFNGYVSIHIPLDICDDCKNSSNLLKDVWSRDDFEDLYFKELLKEKLVDMIKEE